MSSLRAAPLAHSRPVWLGTLAGAAVLFSLALACATPFAALAAVAALRLSGRDAFAVIVVCWLVNQSVGYGLLGYPIDGASLGWGTALGVSALAAVAAARIVGALARGAGHLVEGAAAFGAAFLAQQATVLAAWATLPADPAVFGGSVLFFLLWTNALAFAGLLALQLAGERLWLAAPRPAHA